MPPHKSPTRGSERDIGNEITLSELCDVSADVTRVLDNLFGSGSYTAMIRGNMTEPNGIDIRIDVGGVTVVVITAGYAPPASEETGIRYPCPQRVLNEILETHADSSWGPVVDCLIHLRRAAKIMEEKE